MTILHPDRVSLVKSLAVKASQRVVLVGGGHAHVQVIKALNTRSRPKDMQVSLIDIQKSASYSGMVPGAISRFYSPDETLLHLEPLANWAGIQFHQDQVVDIDFEQNLVYLKNEPNQPIPFDVVSIDIGSASRGLNDVPGAREYTIPTRPIWELVKRIDEAEQQLGETAHVVVVGGGVAGIELSMSIRGRWESILPNGTLQITILNSGSELISNESPACQLALNDILERRCITVRHDCQVKEITENVVELQDGEKIEYTKCLWATGAAAHPLAETLRKRGLAINDRGWIRVNEHLQSLSHPQVFAAGDCSVMEVPGIKTPPKAGVYAVRSGPILTENLPNYLENKPLKDYIPQDDFLKIIICGDGTAVGFRFGIPLYGKWVMKMKDAIDTMFMDLFKEENLPDLTDGTTYDVSQYDAATDQKQLPRLEAHEAAELLQRTDDGVDYEVAWNVLRQMTKNQEYREEVLACIESRVAVMA
jgi:selenide,water dikinase